MPDPTLFGRYRSDRRIGSGAFATVWLAHDDLLDSPVAVKVLAENWTDRLDIRARFSDEARILRRADSDHVVRVHDIGELDDGRPYFVMTYADAGTLAERLSGPLAEPLAVQHGLGVADGLAVLHRLGVVHRDVKPSNVLFHSGRGTERLLIADLGLARAVAHASGFTLAAGTPGYMAPEQAVMGGSVDARADVYALGALITHMLSGHTPRIVSDERSAVFARHDADGIPGRLGEIVRRALAPYPEERYASAVEMAAELRQLSNPAKAPVPEAHHQPRREAPRREPQLERPATPPVERPVTQVDDGAEPAPLLGRSRVFRSRGRRRRIAVAAAVVVLAGAAGGGYAYWNSRVGTKLVTGGDVSVRVPKSWAGQVKSGSWQLDGFGVKGQTGQGVEVASDVPRWNVADSTTPGVFVGVSSRLHQESNTTLLSRVSHPGCTKKARAVPHNINGASQHWSGCAGDMTFDETVERRDGYIVYVQVKQPSNEQHTDAILESVRVSNAT
ncbi:MAG TPA: serine/threonine-protein kinase [Mycobacteriales bacterium]|jgi:tRNA A-37 threonylcarbamoyl transferase component Bud32|nr:serine/threonine-protein kinase [Mycobacteriales bacterium]